MKAKEGLKRLLSVVIVLCMILAMSLSAFAASNAAAGNDNVEADKTGVLLVQLGVDVGGKEPVYYYRSSGFLVNEDHLVTCYHSVHFADDDEAYGYFHDKYGMDKEKINKKMTIAVNLYRDQVVKAKVVTESKQADIAILKLSQPLQNRTLIKINTGEVKSTAPCYALGFPGSTEMINDSNTYTPEDVSVEIGAVSKKDSVSSVSVIMHSAKISGGCSGGPLVNYGGSVIGINSFGLPVDLGTQYYYAVSADELIHLMDSYGIKYSPDDQPIPDPVITDDTGNDVGGTEPDVPVEPVTIEQQTVDKSALESAIKSANDIDQNKYTKETADSFSEALEAAKTVNSNPDATKEQVESAVRELTSAQDALKAKPSVPIPAIIAIAAAVIILIIVIIMVTGRKKPAPVGYDEIPPYGGGGMAGGPAPYSGGDIYAGKPEGGTTVLGGGGGTETTVLGGDSGATTVLSSASLTRMKTGERIPITRDQFKIGRERSRVDYCISDNTAVGRLHAILVSRGGNTFVVDQNSTNCTFVNSNRAPANQEIRLNNGDKISFADEEFTFNAF